MTVKRHGPEGSLAPVARGGTCRAWHHPPPGTLATALDRLKANRTVTSWFPESFVSVYRAHKASEIAYVAEMDIAAQCAAYEETY